MSHNETRTAEKIGSVSRRQRQRKIQAQRQKTSDIVQAVRI